MNLPSSLTRIIETPTVHEIRIKGTAIELMKIAGTLKVGSDSLKTYAVQMNNDTGLLHTSGLAQAAQITILEQLLTALPELVEYLDETGNLVFVQGVAV
jgi:predicted MarR family transcription regulator